MIVPDANLILYAHDSTSPFNAPAARWWSTCLSGAEPVGLTYPVLFAFVRISTNARVYASPMSLAESSECVTRWLNRRITRVLVPTQQHYIEALGLLKSSNSIGGNLVTDAQIAAIALAHKASVHTADRDFQRFPKLRCVYPLD